MWLNKNYINVSQKSLAADGNGEAVADVVAIDVVSDHALEICQFTLPIATKTRFHSLNAATAIKHPPYLNHCTRDVQEQWQERRRHINSILNLARRQRLHSEG